jgi:hypothetical protein
MLHKFDHTFASCRAQIHTGALADGNKPDRAKTHTGTLADDHRPNRAWSEKLPAGIADRQGTATNAELWGLIMSTTGVPPLANTEVKIVWRITGSGFFDIVALGPNGMKAPPSQGPTRHLGSNWNRPGDEWGTVFTFPVAGCWDLHITRDNAFGDVWLKIVEWVKQVP